MGWAGVVRDSDGSEAALTLLVLGGGALAAWYWWGSGRPDDGPGRAIPLTPTTTTPDGATTVSDEAEALGRVITSEADSYSEAERRAIGWCVRNRAHRRKTTVARLVCNPCGPCCKGRPFSSARAAKARDLTLAREIFDADPSRDPVGGAGAFFEPRLQDKWVKEGRPGYRLDAEALRAKWRKDGQRQLATVGAFEFWS